LSAKVKSPMALILSQLHIASSLGENRTLAEEAITNPPAAIRETSEPLRPRRTSSPMGSVLSFAAANNVSATTRDASSTIRSPTSHSARQRARVTRGHRGSGAIQASRLRGITAYLRLLASQAREKLRTSMR
jgi:hypothetical protein